MSKQILLLGGGGHGRVVLDAMLESGLHVSGILDPRLKVGATFLGVAVVGGDERLNQVEPTEVVLANGLGASPDVRTRKQLFESLKARNFSFCAVRHSSAVIAQECSLGEGSQIMAATVLQNRVRIEGNAVINTRASVDHDCVVGAHSFVSPGAVLCGGVWVADAVFIGAAAVLLPGIRIGSYAVVGAGAVVTKDVPEGWIVAGNPAVKLGRYQ